MHMASDLANMFCSSSARAAEADLCFDASCFFLFYRQPMNAYHLEAHFSPFIVLSCAIRDALTNLIFIDVFSQSFPNLKCVNSMPITKF